MSTSLGYKSNFLVENLALPKVATAECAPLKTGNGKEIKYTHFSLFLHIERKLPILAAVNIKGEAYSAFKREGGDSWRSSNQVESKYQLSDSFYEKDENTFDKGHMVRRVDPCWGSEELSKQADKDTFNFANCAPQHKKLNREGGAWFELEQHVMENGVKNKVSDISVFSGPVLSKTDLPFKKQFRKSDVLIPSMYWKVIAWKKSNGKLYAVGFTMSQYEWIKNKLIQPPLRLRAPKPRLEDDYFENLKFKSPYIYQVPISEIEKATGIKFNWTNVSFPYRKKTPQKVQALEQKKVYPVRTLRAMKTVKKGKGPKYRNLQKGIAQEELGKAKTMEYVKNGFAPVIRRFSLSNITL